MNIVIIEDEKPAARRLKRMLATFDLHIIEMLHSVEEAINWFEHHQHPDLIFLDIQLSDGLSFEIFEGTTISSAIIFTTAYDEYALKAFKLNSIDYLLKPIDEEELGNAIRKYKSRQSQQTEMLVNIEDIREFLINPIDRKYKKRFTIKVGQHLKIIRSDQIECFYSEHKATYMYTNEKRSYLLDHSLEYWQDQLDPAKFFRVNRTFIVHINAIKDIISYTNSRLQLKLLHFDEANIIVSREKVKSFKSFLG